MIFLKTFCSRFKNSCDHVGSAFGQRGEFYCVFTIMRYIKALYSWCRFAFIVNVHGNGVFLPFSANRIVLKASAAGISLYEVLICVSNSN